MCALGLALFGLSAIHLARAGGTNWSIWLYDPQSSRLVRLFMDGTTQDTQIIPPERYAIGDMTFSPGGDLAAVCLFPTGGDGAQVLAFYEIASARFRVSYLLQPMQPCTAARSAFDAQGTQFALATLKPQPDPTVLPGWMVIGIDSTSGAALYTLSSDDPAAAGIGSPGDLSPFVLDFQPDAVSIALMPFMAEGSSSPAYLLRWQPPTGAISLIETVSSAGMDLLPNGEVIWLAKDPSLPQPSLPPNPTRDYNVLMVRDSSGAEYPIFSTTGGILWDAQFIDDGRKIAIIEKDPARETFRAVILDRSGASSDLPGDVSNNLIPAPLGCLTWATTTIDTYEITLFTFAKSGELQPPAVIWTSPVTTWLVVWHDPLALPEGLAPFPAVKP